MRASIEKYCKSFGSKDFAVLDCDQYDERPRLLTPVICEPARIRNYVAT